MATEEEQRAYHLHQKYGITLRDANHLTEAKLKPEGWRVCLTEGKSQITVPHTNDKNYQACRAIIKEMLIKQPELFGKLSIKPKLNLSYPLI